MRMPPHRKETPKIAVALGIAPTTVSSYIIEKNTLSIHIQNSSISTKSGSIIMKGKTSKGIFR